MSAGERARATDDDLARLAAYCRGVNRVGPLSGSSLAAVVDELIDRRARVTTGGPAPAMTPPEVWRNGPSSRPSTATDSPASAVRRGPAGELVEAPS